MEDDNMINVSPSTSRTRKKFLLKKHTLAYNVAEMIGNNSQKNICRLLHISKQRLHYWLRRLVQEGILQKDQWASYRLAEGSKEILGELTMERKKEQIRLENMRYNVFIFDGADILIDKLQWDKVQNLNKVKIYHGKFKGYTIRLFECASSFLEITCKQWFGYEPYELVYQARCDAENIIGDLEKKYDVKMGRLNQAMDPEFAIPTPLAEGVLTHMWASQIRTPEATFNRSKGRNADFEPKSLQLAHQVVQMPMTIEAIYEQNEILMSKLDSIRQELNDLKTNQSNSRRRITMHSSATLDGWTRGHDVKNELVKGDCI